MIRKLFFTAVAVCTVFSVMSAWAGNGVSLLLTPDGALKLDDLVRERTYPMAVADTAHADTSAGPIAKGDVLFTIPFSYVHVLKVRSDVTVPHKALGIAITQNVLAKDMLGFEGPPVVFPFASEPQPVYCFFFADVFAFRRPICYAATRHAGGVNLFRMAVDSDLPNVYARNDGFGALIEGRQAGDLFDDRSQTIDHAFKLEIVVRGWNAKTVTLQARVDGLTVDNPLKVPLDAGGAARIVLPNGIVTLKPEGDDKLDVTFAESPPVG